MSAGPLHRVLEATGYLSNGDPAPGVRLDEDAQRSRRGRDFSPDASWRSSSALTVYFKYEDVTPSDDLVDSWRREVWNEGFAPLLWVVSPDRIDLYNGFGRPQEVGDAARHRLQTFENLDATLVALDEFAGRLAMETGQFWLKSKVDRKSGVDHQLLGDLASLERDLVRANLDRDAAQGLIGRTIFTQFLIDRAIIDADRLKETCGHRRLPPILRDHTATKRLFAWLGDTFNGDMFPPSSTVTSAKPVHLARVADFLDAVDPTTGQRTLFPYQFNVIPVELISSIYEQFAHAAAPALDGRGWSSEASRLGVYYTRLPVVSLVLDEVMNGLTGRETVLDLTCGSGVFLVEALRRLVQLQSGAQKASRELIRSTLSNQICGVDISEAAVRVAAFSLYLAALELDPDPHPPEALRFRPLIGETLFIGDAHTIEKTEQGAAQLKSKGRLKTFDVIVGNPPWSYKGLAGTAERRRGGTHGPAQPRGEGLDFVRRAAEFAHGKTRFGLILSAMPFFSGSMTGAAAVRHIVRQLSPVTLVNLSNLSGWLFPAATMPAVALLARHRMQRADQVTVVRVPWSPAGAKTHTFEIAPSDIISLKLADWERQPVQLKTAAVGRRRDLLLLDSLTAAHDCLGARLTALKAELRDGLILGRPHKRTRDASTLANLEFLQVDDLQRFGVPETLPTFRHRLAQWPRARETFSSPLLLVKEFLNETPRPITAVADRDLVFTDAYFGAAFPASKREAAHLLAGVLCSALASWFFIMTASEFGLWKRRLLVRDVALLPTPDLDEAVHSPAGRHILQLERGFRTRAPSDEGLTELDEAVFDLYRLDAADRVVARDGLFRASWEWQAGRLASVQPAATAAVLKPYAQTFLGVIDSWLSARKQRRMRGEVFDLPHIAALRVVRFVLEQRPGPSVVEVLRPDAALAELLARVGDRLNVRLASELVGQRELRVHGRDEVVIIKPAARRHWMGVSALEDADAVIAESIAGKPA